MDGTDKKSIQDTLQYYNRNAKDFVGNTVTVDFTATQTRFVSKLGRGSHILDFGCGSGRDTKYFLSQGYRVTATDGSVELCKLASEYTGIPVKHMMFQELEEKEIYDGIWACSSILHLPLLELNDVFHRITAALKKDGVLYTSFKYGSYEGKRNGRYFTDMTEDRFSDILKDIKGLELEEQWVTSDVRPGRGDEKWLNIILRKI
ncbi:MAG TPA: SAM-dependent methyltransferase [Lachnospiraceae bacterium]|nr:SAM-dependent methyltransferase [Lachnospiraceae bacterium]HBI62547.1 SAM-dependent methyltransferase [Lachnospiraceae bacterium]